MGVAPEELGYERRKTAVEEFFDDIPMDAEELTAELEALTGILREDPDLVLDAAVSKRIRALAAGSAVHAAKLRRAVVGTAKSAVRAADWAEATKAPVPDQSGTEEADDPYLRLLEEMNEDALARAFAHRYEAEFRFNAGTGFWMRWDGNRWMKDETGETLDLARGVARDCWKPMGICKERDQLAKASTSINLLKLAAVDRRLATAQGAWDKNGWLLGTPGGVVDLRTGQLRPSDPSDLISRSTAVTPADPAVGCDPPHPIWSRFLDEATKGDKDLQRFLKQMVGYALTSEANEECVFFIYGPGGNGKGVVVTAIRGIMGEYAQSAAMDTFMVAKGERHPEEFASMAGARLVIASETEEGRQFAESKIKELSGNEGKIRARFMNKNSFEFRATFKLLFVGNSKPSVKSVDEAIKRRFKMIPFNHMPAKKDRDLKVKLEAEYPAILRWAIDGCLDWQRNGLITPKVVEDANNEYFAENDRLTNWIGDCCHIDEDEAKADDTTAFDKDGNVIMAERSVDLFGSWREWNKARNYMIGTMSSFSQLLQKAGYKRVDDLIKLDKQFRRARGFSGLTLSQQGRRAAGICDLARPKEYQKTATATDMLDGL